MFLGLTSGIVVFTISITGCMYVFEEEIRDATESAKLYAPPRQMPFIGLEKVIANFQTIAPKEKIVSIAINKRIPNATVELSTKKNSYFFNPYNGTLVYKGQHDWLDTVEEIHKTLLMGETGKVIQHWSVVTFVIMLISGMILWFPGQMRLLKQSLSIKWQGTIKRINYDLHNVLGFYASWILVVISLTGLFFAFKEVKTAAAFFTGTKLTEGKKITSVPPAIFKSLPERYNSIYETTSKQYPGANFIVISVRKSGELRVRILYPYRWSRNQNTFFFDEGTGQLLRAKFYKEFNGADLIEATNYDLHTGRIFGIFGKIVAFIASLISASLPVTGFIIWLRKKRKSHPKG